MIFFYSTGIPRGICMSENIEEQNLREIWSCSMQQLIGGTLAELAEAALAFLEEYACGGEEYSTIYIYIVLYVVARGLCI